MTATVTYSYCNRHIKPIVILICTWLVYFVEPLIAFDSV